MCVAVLNGALHVFLSAHSPPPSRKIMTLPLPVLSGLTANPVAEPSAHFAPGTASYQVHVLSGPRVSVAGAALRAWAVTPRDPARTLSVEDPRPPEPQPPRKASRLTRASNETATRTSDLRDDMINLPLGVTTARPARRHTRPISIGPIYPTMDEFVHSHFAREREKTPCGGRGF